MCLIVPLNLLALIHLDKSIQETFFKKGDAFMPDFFDISFTCMVIVSMGYVCISKHE